VGTIPMGGVELILNNVSSRYHALMNPRLSVVNTVLMTLRNMSKIITTYFAGSALLLQSQSNNIQRSYSQSMIIINGI